MRQWLAEKTGIYALGFDPDSVAGLLLPILFVVIIGGALAMVIFMTSR
jgi:hypothetical protein